MATRTRTSKQIQSLPDSPPTAIITSDIELRAYQPTCRTDDHWKAQEKKIHWLTKLRKKYNCPIFDGGDLFDKKYKKNPSHELIAWAINNLPGPFFTVPGNHDLPGKSIENYSNSAMHVLEEAGVLNGFGDRIEALPNVCVSRIPWGVEIKELPISSKHKYNVLLIHVMVYDKEKPFPGCEGYEKNDLLKIFSNFDLIVCGHHHATFSAKKGKTILINPGSLMRNEADQEDFKPHVFLWYAEEQKIIPVAVPIAEGVVSREHLDKKVEKDKRLSAFIERLGQQTETGIKFERNLEQLLVNQNKKIVDKVWEYYEGK